MSKTVDGRRFESDPSLGYVNRESIMRETLLHILLFLERRVSIDISRALATYRQD